MGWRTGDGVAEQELDRVRVLRGRAHGRLRRRNSTQQRIDSQKVTYGERVVPLVDVLVAPLGVQQAVAVVEANLQRAAVVSTPPRADGNVNLFNENAADELQQQHPRGGQLQKRGSPVSEG